MSTPPIIQSTAFSITGTDKDVFSISNPYPFIITTQPANDTEKNAGSITSWAFPPLTTLTSATPHQLTGSMSFLESRSDDKEKRRILHVFTDLKAEVNEIVEAFRDSMLARWMRK